MNQLKIFTAEAARDEGIRKAIDHTEAVTPGWKELAYEKLKQFLRAQTEPFQVEEVRSFAAVDDDFPLPEHNRAWGGIIRRAAFEGLIKKIGIQSTSNPKSHCANAALWVKV